MIWENSIVCHYPCKCFKIKVPQTFSQVPRCPSCGNDTSEMGYTRWKRYFFQSQSCWHRHECAEYSLVFAMHHGEWNILKEPGGREAGQGASRRETGNYQSLLLELPSTSVCIIDTCCRLRSLHCLWTRFHPCQPRTLSSQGYKKMEKLFGLLSSRFVIDKLRQATHQVVQRPACHSHYSQDEKGGERPGGEGPK